MEERDQGVCPNCLSRSFLPIELLLLYVSYPEVTPVCPPVVDEYHDYNMFMS